MKLSVSRDDGWALLCGLTYASSCGGGGLVLRSTSRRLASPVYKYIRVLWYLYSYSGKVNPLCTMIRVAASTTRGAKSHTKRRGGCVPPGRVVTCSNGSPCQGAVARQELKLLPNQLRGARGAAIGSPVVQEQLRESSVRKDDPRGFGERRSLDQSLRESRGREVGWGKKGAVPVSGLGRARCSAPQRPHALI